MRKYFAWLFTNSCLFQVSASCELPTRSQWLKGFVTHERKNQRWRETKRTGSTFSAFTGSYTVSTPSSVEWQCESCNPKGKVTFTFFCGLQRASRLFNGRWHTHTHTLYIIASDSINVSIKHWTCANLKSRAALFTSAAESTERIRWNFRRILSSLLVHKWFKQIWNIAYVYRWCKHCI